MSFEGLDQTATGRDFEPSKSATRHPAALAEALRAMKTSPYTPSDSSSEVESESKPRQHVSIRLRRESMADSYDNSAIATPEITPLDTSGLTQSSSSSSDQLGPPQIRRRSSTGKKTYVIASDDAELREILKRGLERQGREGKDKRRKGRFQDLVFTKKFSTFDRQSEEAANSPFHGFYALFWIAVTFLLIKMAADNWRKTGSPLGTNAIMKYMFRRDVLVLLLSDGVMCGLTGVTWIIQRLVFQEYIDWDRSGWIIQNIWQSIFIASVVGLTLIRDWPWTHTVFFVLHGLVMLMKQHSYAFYNGYLSSAYKKRRNYLSKLKQLENMEPADTASPTSPNVSTLQTSHLDARPSATAYQERRLSQSKSGAQDSSDIENIFRAIQAGDSLSLDQLQMFERLIKWEADALSDELRGEAADADPSRHYPRNLSLANHCEYVVLPTLVYELQYPRSERIDWAYVAEKGAATFGILLVMVMVSQTFIHPWVVRALAMREQGLTTAQRFREFPWMLSDLVFPFMMEYLLSWYLIWETILNILAELTYFADRSFYDAWWNSVSWDQFARDWNRPVHNFLLRHVYHSSMRSSLLRGRVGNRHAATLLTFLLSACAHELVMWCIFKKLRGYLLALQMLQLPLVRLSRTRWLRGRRTLGNVLFWAGIFTGPSLLCSLYLIL